MLRPVPGVMDGSVILLLECGMEDLAVGRADIYRFRLSLNSAAARYVRCANPGNIPLHEKCRVEEPGFPPRRRQAWTSRNSGNSSRREARHAAAASIHADGRGLRPHRAVGDAASCNVRRGARPAGFNVQADQTRRRRGAESCSGGRERRFSTRTLRSAPRTRKGRGSSTSRLPVTRTTATSFRSCGRDSERAERRARQDGNRSSGN
jgi:hypothetical protein